MKITPFFLAGLLLSAPTHATPPSTLVQGLARVVDGDTLAINGQRIRLYGIDAPESAQQCYHNGKGWDCGQASAWELTHKIAGAPVSCQVRDTDRYGRLVAVCQTSSVLLNASQVEGGWALAYAAFSKEFLPHQARAKAAGRGIWTSQWESPEKFRKSHPHHTP